MSEIPQTLPHVLVIKGPHGPFCCLRSEECHQDTRKGRETMGAASHSKDMLALLMVVLM